MTDHPREPWHLDRRVPSPAEVVAGLPVIEWPGVQE